MSSKRQFVITIHKNPSQLQVVYGKDLRGEEIRDAIRSFKGQERIQSTFKLKESNIVIITLKNDLFSNYYKFRLELEMALAERFIYRGVFKSDVELPGKSQSEAWIDLHGLVSDSSDSEWRQLSLFSFEDTVKKL